MKGLQHVLKQLRKGKGLTPGEYLFLVHHIDTQSSMITRLNESRDQIMNDGCTCSPKCLPACRQQRATVDDRDPLPPWARRSPNLEASLDPATKESLGLKPKRKRKPTKRKAAAKKKRAARRS